MKAVLVFGYGFLLAMGVGLFTLGIDYHSGTLWGLGIACIVISGALAGEIYERMI